MSEAARAARIAAEQQLFHWIRQRHDAVETSDAVSLVRNYARLVRAEERAETRKLDAQIREDEQRRADFHNNVRGDYYIRHGYTGADE